MNTPRLRASIALDLDALKKPDITFWSVWRADTLVGCGALKELERGHGEIKSMRTVHEFRGRGAGKLMLWHILDEARKREYDRLSLESFGFVYCEPFADYVVDPNSVFMTKELSRR